MPDKLLQDGETIKGVLGIVSACIVSGLALLGIKIKSNITKQKDNLEKFEKTKKDAESLYREGIEKTHFALWKRIDENGDDLKNIGKQIERLEGRFEDLQRAFERMQIEHFEMTCKNLMKKG